MSNLIKLLLDNAQQVAARRMKTGTTAQLDAQTVALHNLASMTAVHRTPEPFQGNASLPLAYEENLSRLLAAELSRVNLCHPQQYARILQAIQVWNPKPSPELSIQSGQRIRQALWKILPELQKQQQLNAECSQYKNHLKTDIETQLRQDHPHLYAEYAGNKKLLGVPLPGSGRLPTVRTQSGKNMERFAASYSQGVPHGSKSLNIALQKYLAVDHMQQTLRQPQSVPMQLTHFRQALNAHHTVLEQDRDSAAMKFLKGIATLLSLGVAALCGIWSVKGEAVAGEMQNRLETQPVLPALALCSA